MQALSKLEKVHEPFESLLLYVDYFHNVPALSEYLANWKEEMEGLENRGGKM